MFRHFALGAAVFLQTLSALGQPIPVDTVVEWGDPAPGTSFFFGDDLRCPILNDEGSVAFLSQLRNASGASRPFGLWYWDGVLAPIALHDDPIPDHPGEFYQEVGCAHLTDLGELAFTVNEASGQGDLIGPPGAIARFPLEPWALGGDQVIGFDDWNDLQLGTLGALVESDPQASSSRAFGITGPGRGFFLGGPGVVTHLYVGAIDAPTDLLEIGDPFPALFPGAKLADITDVDSTENEQLLLEVELEVGTGSVTSDDDTMLVTWTEAQGFEVLLREGDPVPGLPGYTVVTSRVETIGPGGELAIRADLAQPGEVNLSITYVGSFDTGIAPVPLPGEQAPDLPAGTTIASGSDHSNFTAQGFSIVKVDVMPPAAAVDTAFYGRLRSGELRLLFSESDHMLLPPGLLREIHSTAELSHGGPHFRSVNDRGQLALQLTYGASEREGVFLYDASWALADQPACSNALDDDGDGLFDYPEDPGCFSSASTIEDPQCQDGLDNDGTFGTDFDGGESILGTGNGDPDGPDPQCIDAAWRNREAPKSCGLGFELAFLIVPLATLRKRRALSLRR